MRWHRDLVKRAESLNQEWTKPLSVSPGCSEDVDWPEQGVCEGWWGHHSTKDCWPPVSL